MEGKKCDYPTCGLHDFLPFECEYCHGNYCLEHRSRFIHSCSIIEQKDDAQLKSETLNSMKPTVSELFHAVEHRFDNEFQDYNPNNHYSIKSSHLDVDSLTKNTKEKILKLENSIDTNNTLNSNKNKNIANKTKQILFKNRAIGKNEIPVEDRFYVEINFLSSGESKFMFFGKYHTISEIVEYLSNNYSLLSYHTPTRPNQLSLAIISSSIPPSPLITPDEIYEILLTCDRNQLFSKQYEEFSTLHLLPVPIELVVKAQSELQELQSSLVQEQSSSDQASSLSPNTPSLRIPSPELTLVHEYAIGNSIRYTPSNSSGDDNEIWFGSILAIHRDDVFPYYTIRILNPITGIIKEKQTDMSTLHPSSDPLATSSPSSAAADQLFPVKFSYQGKTYPNTSIPRQGTVLSLKIKIIEMENLIEKGLNIFNLKLIYKGKILKNNEMLLKGKELNILDNGTVMIMKEHTT